MQLNISMFNLWDLIIQFFLQIVFLIVIFCNLIIRGDIFGVNLLEHAAASLIRVGVGFAIAIITAIPLGLLIGWNKKLSSITHPFIEMVRHIPPIAWIPFSIVFFGLGLFSSAFIVWLGAFFPILLSTASGVKNLGRAQVDVAITLGAKERDLIFKVVFPAILPEIITGMRVGLGVGWMCVIASEMIGLRKPVGLGFFVLEMQYLGRYLEMIAGMIMIGLVGLFLDYGLRFLENRILRWREEVGK
jgi:ABC-type nitrate/sulfonate/bicarbonate transport system permease component